MRRITSPVKYELHQAAVAKALVESVRAELEEAGLKGRALKRATESVAFSVAAIYDGSTHVAIEDDHLVPVLGFALGRMRNQLLVPESGGSDIHELIAGAVKAEFAR